MNIRRLQPDDVNKGLLETLENLSEVGTDHKMLFVRTIKEMQKSKICDTSAYNTFVAEIDDEIVGHGTLLVEQKLIHNCRRVGHIEDIVTRKGYEGKGIGTAIVKRLIREAKILRCEQTWWMYKAILDCSEENVSFYEKLGFRRHEIGMRLDL